MSLGSDDIRELLARLSSGDKTALNTLITATYEDLHKLARHYICRQEHCALQTTELINEAYLKLATGAERHWGDRNHFLAVAAKAMQQVLIDHARANHTGKRGGAAQAMRIDGDIAVSPTRRREIIALDDALAQMSKVYPRQEEVIELHYFGGLRVAEVAKLLHVSPDTIVRDLRFARGWLNREVRP